MTSSRLASIMTLLLWLGGVSARGDIIINEVMANEPGSRTDLEWVELWNWSDTDISLSGLSFEDGGVLTPLADSVTLASRGFILLVRDAQAFEEERGDGSGEWGDSESESFRILQASMSLRNSADTVVLLRDGDTVSMCLWTRSSADGVSVERADPRAADSCSAWGMSIDNSGSTPGARNAITPGDNDLRLKSTMEVVGNGRNYALVNATIANVGLAQSLPNNLRAGIDIDGDSLLSESESAVENDIVRLDEYDSVSFQVQLEAPFGYNTIIATLGADDNSADNDTLVTLYFGTANGLIVINEILPDPESPLESEWIELFNALPHDLMCNDWQLCDEVGCASVSEFALSSNEYLILCEDSAEFRSFYGDIGSSVLQVDGWRSLNSSGDMVRLLDGAGMSVDSMYYIDANGGNLSIERIDPHASGFDLSNWYRSTSNAGSTPGAMNSVIAGFGADLAIELGSKVISPDGDGVDDLLSIRYSVPQGAALTLKVFDLNGVAAHTIFDERYLSSGEYLYDGRCADGRPLDVGLYVLYAKLSGAAETETKLVFAVVGR